MFDSLIENLVHQVLTVSARDVALTQHGVMIRIPGGSDIKGRKDVPFFSVMCDTFFLALLGQIPQHPEEAWKHLWCNALGVDPSGSTIEHEWVDEVGCYQITCRPGWQVGSTAYVDAGLAAITSMDKCAPGNDTALAIELRQLAAAAILAATTLEQTTT